MSIKYALLSVIDQDPRPVAEIKTAFEELTDHAWPLNVGQVYQSVKRFVRDGLVAAEETQASVGRQIEYYRITDKGKEELAQWWDEPILRPIDDRIDLVIKLAVSLSLRGTPPALTIVDEQRAALLAQLREITTRKREVSEPTQQLLMEYHVFSIEAQMRWLDLVEAHVPPTATSTTEE